MSPDYEALTQAEKRLGETVTVAEFWERYGTQAVRGDHYPLPGKALAGADSEDTGGVAGASQDSCGDMEAAQ